ncbi:MAG: hypothetical protein JKY65_18185 [Planctomycetes bacterium]|nr:hypothetical protein [Planctomycetota bacterium]
MNRRETENHAWRRQQLETQLKGLRWELSRKRPGRREARPAVWEEIGEVHHRLGDSERALLAWQRAMRYAPPSRERLAAQGLYAAGVAAPGPIARCWARVHAHLKEDEQAARNGVLPSRRAKAKAELREFLLKERGADTGYSYLCKYAGIERKPGERRRAAWRQRDSERPQRGANASPRQLKVPSSPPSPRAQLAQALVQLTYTLGASSQPLAALHLLARLHASKERGLLLAPEQLSALKRMSVTPCPSPLREAQRRCLLGAVQLVESIPPGNFSPAQLGRARRSPPPEPIAELRAGLGSLLDAVLETPAEGGPAPWHLAQAFDWIQAHAGSAPEIALEIHRVYQSLSEVFPERCLTVLRLQKGAGRLLASQVLIAPFASNHAALSLKGWESLAEFFEQRRTSLPVYSARAAQRALTPGAAEISEFTLPLLTNLLREGGALAESLRSEALRWPPYARAWADLAQVELYVEAGSPLAFEAFDILRERVEVTLKGKEAMRILTRLVVCVATLPETEAESYVRLEESLLNRIERSENATLDRASHAYLASNYALALIDAAENRAHSRPAERSRSLLRIEGCIRYAFAQLDRLNPAHVWSEAVAGGLEALERCSAQEPSLLAEAARIAAGLLERKGPTAHFGGHLALSVGALRGQRWCESVASLRSANLYPFDLRELVLFVADLAAKAAPEERSRRAIAVAKLAQDHASAGMDFKEDGPELVFRLAALLKPSEPTFAW